MSCSPLLEALAPLHPQAPSPLLLPPRARALGGGPAPPRRNIHDITLSYTFYRVNDEDASNLDDEGGVRVHTWTSGPVPPGITLAPGVVLPPGIGPAPAAEGAGGAGGAAAAAVEGDGKGVKGAGSG
jgi:hypothetical protein